MWITTIIARKTTNRERRERKCERGREIKGEVLYAKMLGVGRVV